MKGKERGSNGEEEGSGTRARASGTWSIARRYSASPAPARGHAMFTVCPSPAPTPAASGAASGPPG